MPQTSGHFCVINYFKLTTFPAQSNEAQTERKHSTRIKGKSTSFFSFFFLFPRLFYRIIVIFPVFLFIVIRLIQRKSQTPHIHQHSRGGRSVGQSVRREGTSNRIPITDYQTDSKHQHKHQNEIPHSFEFRFDFQRQTSTMHDILSNTRTQARFTLVFYLYFFFLFHLLLLLSLLELIQLTVVK